MSLMTTEKLYKDAEKGKYALAAYDVWGGCLDIIEAIFQAAEEMNSPIIVSAGYKDIEEYIGIRLFAEVVKLRAEKSSILAALHLDHAFEFESVMRAIREGFTSVMFDGSRLPYEENVKITGEIVKVAHSVGVSVEAELGNVGGLEGDSFSVTNESLYTDPDVAQDFIRKTGIDAFAPAIGNAHGFYAKEPKLDFERLAKIKEKVQVPLVLHGATGISMDDLQRSIDLGIRKINLGTIVRHTYVEGIKKYIDKYPKENFNLLHRAQKPLKNLLKGQIKMFGSSRMHSRIEAL